MYLKNHRKSYYLVNPDSIFYCIDQIRFVTSIRMKRKIRNKFFRYDRNGQVIP